MSGELRPRGSFTEPRIDEAALQEVRAHAREVAGPADLDDLVERLADARVVMLGEASHGTSEFYRWRAQVTARLLDEHGFDFVAVEGDWPACYEVNRYVKRLPGSDESVREALAAFDRWPTWMWANWEMAEFLDWLSVHNRDRPRGDRKGFYGLDVYGLHESIAAVVDYLEDVDPGAAERAREAYRCFEPYGEDAQEYARALRMAPEDCEEEVVEVLTELREEMPEYEFETADDEFAAEQNALVARNAEAYYRAMVGSEEDSWNVRDRHMVETLNRLLDHHGPDATAVVWAHNTHVGDARATDMPHHGRVNVGQLVREAATIDSSAAVGFSTHRGSVVAGSEWGAEMAEMTVPEAKADTCEDLFHRAGGADRLLFGDDLPADAALAAPRGHRAIGVVYRPSLESGNYVPTVLPDRYDAVVHVEETTAVHPLELHPDRERVPELYPSGV